MWMLLLYVSFRVSRHVHGDNSAAYIVFKLKLFFLKGCWVLKDDTFGPGPRSGRAGRALTTLPTASQSCINVDCRAQTGPTPAYRASPLCTENKQKKTLTAVNLGRPEHGPATLMGPGASLTGAPLEWRLWLPLQENMTVSSLGWAESEFWMGERWVAPF